MAAKKKAAAKKRSPRGNTSESLHDRILDAALDVAAADGWSAVTPARLAEVLGVSYGHVVAVSPTRTSVAVQLIRRVDHQVLNQVQSVDLTETPRDRLFEVLMARFDALQARRDSYVALIKHVSKHPAVLLMLGPQILHSMALMLIAAGINADGLIGVVRTKALVAAFASVVQTWIKDDSTDMAATMSALDKALGRLESAAKMVQGRRRKSEKKSEKA